MQEAQFAMALADIKNIKAKLTRLSRATAVPIADATCTWTPQKILYLKLKQVPPPSYPWTYNPDVSGYYELTGGLDAFINAIRTGNPPTPRTSTVAGVNGLNFTLEYSSFVIFHLDTAYGWRFAPDQDGVSTDDSTSCEYVNLWQVRDNGDYIDNRGVQPVDTPPPFPPEICHIAYFAAKSPSLRGRSGLTDGLTFFMQFQFPDGTWDGTATIDPEIKNTGHH